MMNVCKHQLTTCTNYRPSRLINTHVSWPPISTDCSPGSCPPVRSALEGDKGGPLESEDALGFSIGADPSDWRLIEIRRPSCPCTRRAHRSRRMAQDGRRLPLNVWPFSVCNGGAICPWGAVSRFGKPIPRPLHRSRRQIGEAGLGRFARGDLVTLSTFFWQLMSMEAGSHWLPH